MPNKNKEQIFLRLSEGFTAKNRIVFSEKLEKYRTTVSDLRQSPKQLKLKLDMLRPEIVRLLKKKRTTNANKRMQAWNMEKENSNQDSAAYKYSKSYKSYHTPQKEEQPVQMKLQGMGYENEQVSENRQRYLGKRTLKFEIEKELELYIPSKFFLVTNNFYKVKGVRM